MAADAAPLVFDRSFKPSPGVAEQIMAGVARVTAPNANAYTFTGTNSYLLGEAAIFLVDPGPDSDEHLDALTRAVDGRPVPAIVLTHTHRDHSALARKAAERFAAPIWFAGQHRHSRPLRRFEVDPMPKAGDWGLVPDRVLKGGERLEAGGLTLEVIPTPGHCANHIALGIAETEWLLSGDHVMGWSSTLVSVPDGSMLDYMTSLDRLIAAPYARYLPAHGGPIDDGRAFARGLKAHREYRNTQILEQLASGTRRSSQLLAHIYPEARGRTRFAAQMTLAAHLEYLEALGEVRISRGLLGTRVRLT